MMKKMFAVAAIATIGLGMTGCSSGDTAEKGQANTSKAVTTVDEAWEQLDDLNYAFSNVSDIEWMETISPSLAQCATGEDQIQVYTAQRGVIPDDGDFKEAIKGIESILKKSGLETKIEDSETTGADEAEEAGNTIVTVYATGEGGLNATVSADNTGYIDLQSFSKCVEGSVDQEWNAPGRAPIIATEDAGELQIVEDENSGEVVEEETPVEE